MCEGVVFNKMSLKLASVFIKCVICADMALRKTNFGSTIVISPWVKFPFSGPISEYIVLKVDIYNLIKLKEILKRVIVVDKLRLGVDHFFSPFQG